MRDSQNATGAFPSVAPAAQMGRNFMRLGWADAGIIVPYVVWKQFGDNEIVNENWDAMLKYLNHVNETRFDHYAMKSEHGKFQYADWLSYEALESHGTSYRDKNGLYPETIDYWNFLGASYWAMDAEMMRDMAKASGRDAAPFEKMLADARQYIKITFFNEDGSFKTDVLNTMQAPALFTLRNNILDGKAKENLIGRLKDNFKEKGNRLQTGFLGTSILLPTLSDNGMNDIAYELLFQRENPSWLYSIDNGATTIWERWNSYTKEKGMAPKGMNSFNHYAYGVVCEWIWETAAGIAADPSTPGFRNIIMKPVPDRRLGHLDAVYKSEAGEIRSSWKYEGDIWTWNFTVPEGTTALVTLPGEKQPKLYQAGSHSISKKI